MSSSSLSGQMFSNGMYLTEALAPLDPEQLDESSADGISLAESSSLGCPWRRACSASSCALISHSFKYSSWDAGLHSVACNASGAGQARVVCCKLVTAAGLPRTQRAAPASSQVNVTAPFPSEKSASPTAASGASSAAAA
eukprot:4317191-Pleurochrysis_carterae.AAC.1